MIIREITFTFARSRRLPQWSEFRALVSEWRARVRSRHELMTLDDRELCDIGLTRTEADKEADKPFWQA